jgi:hypothetical protein
MADRFSLRTHDLLAQQRACIEFGFEMLHQQLGKSDKNSPLLQQLDKHSEVETQPLLQGKLKFGSGSSFFNASFSLEPKDGERPIFYAARAMFDTACPDDLISQTLINQRGLESRLESIPTRTYTGVGGFKVQSSFRLLINWSAENETLLRQNAFFVVPESPFELLLGESFIKANKDLFNQTMHTSFPTRLLGRDNSELLSICQSLNPTDI